MQQFKLVYVVPAVLLSTVILVWFAGCSWLRPTSGVTTDESDFDRLNIPVNFVGAHNIGSIQLEIVYSPSVFEPIEVKKGPQAPDAVIKYEVKEAGRLAIKVIDTSGINGSGAMAQIMFKVLDRDSSSPLDLEMIEALDATTHVGVPTECISGGFDAGSLRCPKVYFND